MNKAQSYSKVLDRIMAGRETNKAQAYECLEDHAQSNQPWYLRLLIGCGTWMGVSLIMTFLLSTGLIEAIADHSFSRILFAILFLGFASTILRILKGDVGHWLLLISSALGQSLILIELHERFSNNGQVGVAASLIVLQIVLIFLLNNSLHRFLSTWLIIGCLLYLALELESPGAIDLIIGLALLTSSLTWIFEEKRSTSKRLYYALKGTDWALMSSALILMIAQSALAALIKQEPGSITGEMLIWHTSFHWLPSLICLGLGLVLLRRFTQDYQLTQKTLVVIASGVLLSVVASYSMPGVMAAVLLLIMGIWRRRVFMQGASIAFVSLFLFVFYYQLDISLLDKSVALIGTGVAFLIMRVAISQLFRESGTQEMGFNAGRFINRDVFGLSFAVLLVLATMAYNIQHKEGIIQNGSTVLLKLRPTDPRSLMQGDYMVLRYAMDQEVSQVYDLAVDGKLIVNLDSQGIANFVGIDDGTALKEGEHKLIYRLRDDNELRLGANSFFFEEGSAHIFEDAVYGELRVSPNGESVLVGLRDKDLLALKP